MAASSRDLMSTGSPSPFPLAWARTSLGDAPNRRRNARLNALSLEKP